MYLTPSEYVILICGGVRPLAKKLEKHHAVISHWRHYVNKAGERGGIPRSYHRRLLVLAEAENLDLTAQDLINGRNVTKEFLAKIRSTNNIHKNFKT